MAAGAEAELAVVVITVDDALSNALTMWVMPLRCATWVLLP